MVSTPKDYLRDCERRLDERQRRWLGPRRWRYRLGHRLLYGLVWATIRGGFRFRVRGRRHVPRSGPVIFAPNHESSLDSLALAAALDYATVRRTFWLGRKGAVLGNRLLKLLNRVSQTVPVDRNLEALSAGAAVLSRGHNLVMFSEGTRTETGEMAEFKFGVGALACWFRVPVIPVRIEGTFEAMPADRTWPRMFAPITVRFGEPVLPECADAVETAADESVPEDHPESRNGRDGVYCSADGQSWRRFAKGVRNRVQALKASPD